MRDLRDSLQIAGEILKIVGAFASFYAVFKLRQIEKKYLFKATVPTLIGKIESSLTLLNAAISDPTRHRTAIAEALNHLIVDVKNLKRKCRGDSLGACRDLLRVIHATRPRRYFWQTEQPMAIGKRVLIEIYGKGSGLIHSLGNDIQDHDWSGK